MSEHFTIIGLGSNLGDCEANLRRAIDALAPHVVGIQESCIYASPAMLPKDAPDDWDVPFLNMAICGQTELAPEQLLGHTMDIEEKLGRERTQHWGPRVIDLDILAYDQIVLDDSKLRIPHPGMLERAFVLLPMRDIAPHWIYPRPSLHAGKTIHEIARTMLDNTHQCRLFKTELAKNSESAT